MSRRAFCKMASIKVIHAQFFYLLLVINKLKVIVRIPSYYASRPNGDIWVGVKIFEIRRLILRR